MSNSPLKAKTNSKYYTIQKLLVQHHNCYKKDIKNEKKIKKILIFMAIL